MTPASLAKEVEGAPHQANQDAPRVALGSLAANQDLSGDKGPFTVARAASRISASRLRTLTNWREREKQPLALHEGR
jgi:hypothetical protein